MKWEGNRLNSTPVVIYGFDNKPKYYDFIVVDAEEKMVGTVRTYARKSASTCIREISSEVKDYRTALSKTGNNGSLFVDWAGVSYAGIRGKSGEMPANIVNTTTGEAVSGVQEIEGEQIIETMKENLLPTLLTYDSTQFAFYNTDPLYQDLKDALNAVSMESIVDSMYISLKNHENKTEAFWAFMETLMPDIDSIPPEEEVMAVEGKGLFSTIKKLVTVVVNTIIRVCTGVDETKYYLNRYVNAGTYKSGTSCWCGPWACGYILYVKTHEDKYSTFESCASSVGEFGVKNFALRLLGRPMTPAEIGWSMPIVSKGKIWVDNNLYFTDYIVYNHIRYTGKPALRLCSAGGGLHWTVAYGTYQTGSYLWRTYYYLQQDNGTFYTKGAYKNPSSSGNYSQVDWWNPWILVYD